MKIVIILFSALLSTGCIQNIFKCPVDTITLKQECAADVKKEEDKKLFLLLGLALAQNANSNTTLTGDQAPVGQLSGNTQAMINQINNNSSCPGKNLVANSGLTKTAQFHSQDMANRDIFSHIGSSGKNPRERLLDANLGGLTSVSDAPLTAWNAAGYNNSTYQDSVNMFEGSNGIQNWGGVAQIIVQGTDTADATYQAANANLGYSRILKNFCDLGFTDIGISKNDGIGANNIQYQWTIIFAKDPK